MLGFMIFNHHNDVIYVKSDVGFIRHIQGMAMAQGLSSPTDIENVPTYVEPNLLVQLFSPFITSQIVMSSQFDNSYSSVVCHDGTVITVQQYECFIFLCIGQRDEKCLQRMLSAFLRLVKLTVGPSVGVLRENKERRSTLGQLLQEYMRVSATEQCYLVEAIERLYAPPEVTSASVSVLSQVLDKLKSSSNSGLIPCHAFILVNNKLLALYSSRSAEELSPADILLLNLLVKDSGADEWGLSDWLDEKEMENGSGNTLQTVTLEQLEGEEAKNGGESCKGVLTLLKTELSSLTPHAIHYSDIAPGVSLVVVSQIGRSRLSGSIISLLESIAAIGSKNCSVQVSQAMLLQAQQLAKKLPTSSNADSVIHSLEKVEMQWNNAKRHGLSDWLSSSSENTQMSSPLEASLSALTECLRASWGYASLPPTAPPSHCKGAFSYAAEKLAPQVSSMCSELSMSRYMEDFPGLVHFIHIDRSNHQLTAPSLHPNEETGAVTKERLWSMVDDCRLHLSNGVFSVMWKDTTFSYAYFLWFEDKQGVAQTPEDLDDDVLIALPRPGIICGDFYRLLTAHCFPNRMPHQLQVCEVFLVHLGLVTAPSVLEQTRRLLSSVWELAGSTAVNLL